MLELVEVLEKYGGLNRDEFTQKIRCDWLVTNLSPGEIDDEDSETTVFHTKDILQMEKVLKHPTLPADKENVLVYPIIKRRAEDSSRVITLGRAKTNDIVIPDSSISKVHAYFGTDSERKQKTVSDMDSTNGTFIKGEKIISNVPYPLKTGAQITFGRLTFTYYTARSFYDVFLS